MTPELTVVIPTYNRAHRLKKLLDALIDQSISSYLFETVIIDDGSEDNTAEIIAGYHRKGKHNIRYYWQKNKFAGGARNNGIMKAKAKIILFMDSDIIPNKEHIEQHLKLHRKYPEIEVAVLGRRQPIGKCVDLLRPDRSMITPVSRMPGGEPVLSAHYFVTANVSLKKELLYKTGFFMEGLRRCEDLEIAWRLRDYGLKLVYCENALAIDTDPIDTVAKVVDEGKRYGLALAEDYCRFPLYRDEVWSLGARFNGGWNHFRLNPWGWVKDALRRWFVNKYTIMLIVGLAEKIPITVPPSQKLRLLCKEIRAYYYRSTFWGRRHPVAVKPFTV